MKLIWKLPQLIVCFVALLLASMACGISSSQTPTATLPAKVDSPLKPKLVGQWEIKNGGTWEGAVLTFGEDETFSVTGGKRQMESTGTYFFISADTISFTLPEYQGSASLQFNSDTQMGLTVQTSTEPFGSMYSAEKLK